MKFNTDMSGSKLGENIVNIEEMIMNWDLKQNCRLHF